MRLQPYREKDAKYIVKWMQDEEGHAKWCANLLPYPLTEKLPGWKEKSIFRKAFLTKRKNGAHIVWRKVRRWINSLFCIIYLHFQITVIE